MEEIKLNEINWINKAELDCLISWQNEFTEMILYGTPTCMKENIFQYIRK